MYATELDHRSIPPEERKITVFTLDSDDFEAYQKGDITLS